QEIGYNVEYKVLNAKNFSVPQNRERLIFIGTRGDKGAKSIFHDILNSRGKYERYLLKDALYNLPKLKASNKKNATNVYDDSGGLIMEQTLNSSNDYINLINNNKKCHVILNGKARFNNDRDI